MAGLIQAAIAIAIGVGIFLLGRWGVRVLATGGPPDVDPDDVIDVEIPYRCIVCGMQLTITHAQDDEVPAPRHCHEEMARIE